MLPQCLCTSGSRWIWPGEAGSGVGDEGEGGAVMIGGHDAADVGGDEVLGPGMAGEPFAAEAVGHPGEHGVQAQGLGVAQAAAVILTRGVEPGVQAGFDPPVVDVGLQPLLGRQL